MKTKCWIMILAVLLLVSGFFAIMLSRGSQDAQAVQIWSEGKLLHTLPLAVDTQIVVETDRGSNTVTVRDGKVAVTAADCPDHYCMKRGFCDGGSQIVCLPNRLVLKFTKAASIDGISG